MTDATELTDDTAELNVLPDPLRPAFEAVSAAIDARGKLEALKRAATDLAIPIRHGMLGIYEIEERLLDLADSHGLIAELTLGTVEGVIANAVRTPALAEKPIEHANGNGHDAAPPDDGYEPPDHRPDDRTAEVDDTARQQTKQRFPLVAFDQVKVDTTRRDYLIKGLLASTGLAVVWGPPKCGKSFWAMDTSMHIALGWEYRGRRVQQVPVVYVALEGQHGFPARVEGFRRQHKVDAAPFFLLMTRLNLIADARALVAAILAQIGDVLPGAVFIDTLNRSLVGSESKDEDMAKYLAAADFVADQLGCAVVIVHHCGIDATRPRGHTSLTGSVESQLAVKRGEADEVIVKVEYAKDFAEGTEVCSRLEPITVGIDPDGDDITTLVLLPAEPTLTAKGNGKKIKGANKVALELLRKAVDEAGEVPPANNHIPPNTRTIMIETWRAYAYQGSITESDKPDARQKAFVRASKKLQEANLVGIWGDRAWIV
jgi:AAA domain